MRPLPAVRKLVLDDHVENDLVRYDSEDAVGQFDLTDHGAFGIEDINLCHL
jgi:hypothetical protein